jgi:hypothetical protein
MIAVGTKIIAAARRRAFQVAFSRTQSADRRQVAHKSTIGIGAMVHSQLDPKTCINNTQPQSTPLSSKAQNPAIIPLRIIIEAHCPAEYETAMHDKYTVNGGRL